MADDPKNLAASVKQRLLNMARDQNRAFDILLVRFALERLLFRLSLSAYRDNYILKGGMLVTQWWVVGGWSGEVERLFSDMETTEAARQAGWELVAKNPAPLGLHAAPALLNLVLERGREDIAEISLDQALGEVDLSWRKATFEDFSASPNASLFPIFLMFGLSAEANDAEDWKAPFTRRTGIDPKATISPLNFAVQVYRERILRRQLKI
jgi:GTPase-associated system helical domain